MEIQFDSAWKGFKSVLSKIKKTADEAGKDTKLEIILEGDEDFQEFSYEELPTGEVIKEIFDNSTFLKASVFMNDRLKHKATLMRKIIPQRKESYQQEETKSNFDLGREMAEQVKVFLSVSEQVNNSRMNSLQSGFEMMMTQMKNAYDEREKIFMDLSKRDRELIYKEAEANSKKKYDTIESIFNVVVGGAEKVFNWVNENPEKAAEIIYGWRAGGAKEVPR